MRHVAGVLFLVFWVMAYSVSCNLNGDLAAGHMTITIDAPISIQGVIDASCFRGGDDPTPMVGGGGADTRIGSFTIQVGVEFNGQQPRSVVLQLDGVKDGIHYLVNANGTTATVASSTSMRFVSTVARVWASNPPAGPADGANSITGTVAWDCGPGF